MSCEIRKLTPAELPAILALWKAAGLPTKPAGRDHPERLQIEMEQYPDNFIGAFSGERLVGVVLASWDGRKGWVNRVAVHPEFRRRGVGEALIAAAERELGRRGALIIAALIETDNVPSIRLFESCDYVAHGGNVYMTKRKGQDV